MSWPRGLLPAMLVACAWASPAEASPTFPQAIQEGLDMACEPGCRLCHLNDLGGPGNRNMGFGQRLYDNGIALGDPSSVIPALQNYEDAAMMAGMLADVDGDGQSDRDELVMGLDPNIAGDERLCANEIEYGCFATVAPRDERRDTSGALACVVAVVLGAALRRKRVR